MTWERLSSDVTPGGVEAAEVAGHQLVVWCTSDGEVVAMDARCPHQWSHLGAEGVVDGDELVCTAHFWRFDRRGVGSKLNVKGRRDAKADVATFPCRRVDGALEVDLG
jgi:nitrite reductase/ring-hydroxylating ferredoxin subunit